MESGDKRGIPLGTATIIAAVIASIFTLAGVWLGRVMEPKSETLTPTMQIAETLPTYTPYPTSAPLPTYTPYPTYTPFPTYTSYPTSTVVRTQPTISLPTATHPSEPPKPSPQPTTVARPNTSPGSILNVKDTWVQDGVWLTLESVSLTNWWQELTFVMENHTGSGIFFQASDSTFDILDKNGIKRSGLHSFRTSMPTSLASEDSFRFVAGFNTLYQIDPTSVDVPFFYIRVDKFSRIRNAQWKIVVPH